MKAKNTGFTLIELLVVISIIGVLIGLSIFGLQGARESGRDTRRKSDLELIRSGLEIYKADCNVYPTTLGTTLVGDDSTPACLSTNTYIAEIPQDPLEPTNFYLFWSDGVTYEICADLEGGSGRETCGGSDTCGTGGSATDCNYKVTSP